MTSDRIKFDRLSLLILVALISSVLASCSSRTVGAGNTAPHLAGASSPSVVPGESGSAASGSSGAGVEQPPATTVLRLGDNNTLTLPGYLNLGDNNRSAIQAWADGYYSGHNLVIIYVYGELGVGTDNAFWTVDESLLENALDDYATRSETIMSNWISGDWPEGDKDVENIGEERSEWVPVSWSPQSFENDGRKSLSLCPVRLKSLTDLSQVPDKEIVGDVDVYYGSNPGTCLYEAFEYTNWDDYKWLGVRHVY